MKSLARVRQKNLCLVVDNLEIIPSTSFRPIDVVKSEREQEGERD